MNEKNLMDELEELLGSGAPPKPRGGDCGCGGAGGGGRATPSAADPRTLEAELDALESGALERPPGALELSTGELDAELDFAATLGDAEQATLTLDDLLALARANPGLRITLGF
jgi:hypothetical protein